MFVNKLISGGLLAAGLTAQGAASDQPNLLFIFSDDHATQAISAYGSKINQTPNIDRIAKEGAIFSRCHVTNAICGPSRACILTGKFSHKNEFYDNISSRFKQQLTFPQVMRDGGYETGIIGKWHLGDGTNMEALGFDHWAVYTGQGQYYKARYRAKVEGGKNGQSKIVEYPDTYAPEKTTDLAIEWMQKNKEKPFLMMCQFKAPHRHWAPGPKYLTLFDDKDIPEPDTLFDPYDGGRNSAMKRNRMSIAHHLNHGDLKLLDSPYEWNRMSPEQQRLWKAAYDPKNSAFRTNKPKGDDLVRWKYQRYIKDYLRCVQAVDDNIGRLMQFLEKEGLAENTIVIYSSDQGFYLGEKGWYDKRWMYEEALKMPFVIRWPKRIRPKQKIDELVQNTDFAPTFLEMCGLEVPAEMQGASFLPMLKGNKKFRLRPGNYYHYYETPSEHGVPAHFGITTKRFKLIRYYAFGNEKMDEWELFDLRKPAAEQVNLFENEAYLPIRNKLLKLLDSERKRLEVTAGDMGEFAHSSH